MSVDCLRLQGTTVPNEIKTGGLSREAAVAVAGGRARRNNDGVASGPPAWEAGTESIKPLSKQSCSVCSVGPGALEASTHPRLNPSQAPGPALCLHDSSCVKMAAHGVRGRHGRAGHRSEPSHWASLATGRAQPGTQASRATGRGCIPGWLPCLHPHPVGLGYVILMKPRLRGQNQEWEESGRLLWSLSLKHNVGK